MKTLILILFFLWAFFLGVHSVPASAAPFFGYYHVWTEDVADVVDHTNLLWLQTANPRQDLDAMLRQHPRAAFVLEVQPLDQAMVEGQKIHSFDPIRVAAILDAVEAWLKPHRNRLYALSIVDEIETNPRSLRALQSLVEALKARPLLADAKLHVNFDNISPMYSRTPFVIPDGLDFVSITPRYGGAVWYDEMRTRAVLERVAEWNQSHGRRLGFMVIGDGWAPQAADAIHETKARELYGMALRLAKERGIDVVGQVVFAYSEPAGGVKDSPVMREVWRNIGMEFVAGRLPPPEPEPEPEPPPLPFFPVFTIPPRLSF